MTLMTNTAIPGATIDVPNNSTTFWATAGWALGGTVAVPLPTKVHIDQVFTILTHPSLPGRTFRIPFASVPSHWAGLGWV